MPNLGPTELLIVAGILVLLFGAAKLPKLARSLGESARIFKAETKGLHDDDEALGAGTAPGASAARDGKTTESATGRLDEANPREPIDAEMVDGDETGHQKAG